jgi:hypothetical protein
LPLCGERRGKRRKREGGKVRRIRILGKRNVKLEVMAKSWRQIMMKESGHTGSTHGEELLNLSVIAVFNVTLKRHTNK